MTTRSIPWPRILAEGAAIVVSILLAFGIQAWWEGVQERRAEEVALEALHEEFLANLGGFESAHAIHVRLADDTSRLLNMLLAAPTGTRIQVVDSLLVPLVSFLTEDEVDVREYVLGQLIPGLAGHADLSGVLAARTDSGMRTTGAFALTGRTYEVEVSPITRTLIGGRHLLAQITLRGSRARSTDAKEILDLIDRQLAP